MFSVSFGALPQEVLTFSTVNPTVLRLTVASIPSSPPILVFWFRKKITCCLVSLRHSRVPELGLFSPLGEKKKTCRGTRIIRKKGNTHRTHDLAFSSPNPLHESCPIVLFGTVQESSSLPVCRLEYLAGPTCGKSRYIHLGTIGQI